MLASADCPNNDILGERLHMRKILVNVIMEVMNLEMNLSTSAAFTGKIFRNVGRLLLLIALSLNPNC